MWQEKFQQRLRSGFLLRLKFNCLLPSYELELIGCRIDALPTGSHALQLTLWWRGVRPATEDWTAFFHITPSANNAEFVGQLDHAITDHEYPPTEWAVGEVVQEQVQISAAKLQPGSYAVWMVNVRAGKPEARCRRSWAWRCG